MYLPDLSMLLLKERRSLPRTSVERNYIAQSKCWGPSNLVKMVLAVLCRPRMVFYFPISDRKFKAVLRIHLILTWIRILGSTFGKSDSGSRSSNPHLEKVDPEPVPKWIRIRVPIFIFFIKKFMSDNLQCLFLLPPKFRKGISQITKTFSFTFYSK